MKTESTQTKESFNVLASSNRTEEEVTRLSAEIRINKQKIAAIMGSQKQMHQPEDLSDEQLLEINLPMSDEDISRLSVLQIIKAMELSRHLGFTAENFVKSGKIFYSLEALTQVLLNMDKQEGFELNEFIVYPYMELQEIRRFLQELQYHYNYFFADTIDAIKTKLELKQ